MGNRKAPTPAPVTARKPDPPPAPPRKRVPEGSSAPAVRLGRLSDLTQDPRNANKGTERGVGMLETSLRKYGAGRSILADKHGVIIAGNKTHERLADLGMEDVIIVPTDGRRLVVHQRTDLDLAKDPAAVELAIADNRVAEVDLAWDVGVLGELKEAGADLQPFFSDKELEAFLAGAGSGGAGDSKTLGERFGVPPFSVLDARQGYWQDRKRAWLALGIESELGRGGGVWVESATGGPDDRKRAYCNGGAAPGGSPRPAMRLGDDGKTRRGDGRGRAIT